MANNRYEFGHDHQVELLKIKLDQHILGTNNPHQVNSADVGLSSFEQYTPETLPVSNDTTAKLIDNIIVTQVENVLTLSFRNNAGVEITSCNFIVGSITGLNYDHETNSLVYKQGNKEKVVAKLAEYADFETFMKDITINTQNIKNALNDEITALKTVNQNLIATISSLEDRISALETKVNNG